MNKDRKSRIITGCNFIKGLVNDGKTQTAVFERAATRLTELLASEIAGEKDVEDNFEFMKGIVNETKN